MIKEPTIAITMSRQIGAGGRMLGQRLAKRLDFAYLDKDIMQQATQRLGLEDSDLSLWDEKLPTFWDRLIETFAMAVPDSWSVEGRRPPGISEKALFQFESQVIREAAARRSVVVIGRAGFWVLRDHPRLVRVLLHAPVSDRIAELMNSMSLSGEHEARRTIEAIDSQRERFTLAMTGCMAADARNYDLCINTGQTGLELAEEMIVRMVARLRTGSTNSTF